MPPELYPQRPTIVGVAHIGLKVSDLPPRASSIGTFSVTLRPLSWTNPTGSLMLVYFKVNDHQYIDSSLPSRAPRKTGYRTLRLRPRMPEPCATTLPAQNERFILR